LKTNVAESRFGLEELMRLKVRDYAWKSDGRQDHGLIAQEVAEIYPAAVFEGGDDPAMEPWGIDYGRLTPLLVRTIQQQQAQIEVLEARLAVLEAKVNQ
jgi:hypothetical protein